MKHGLHLDCVKIFNNGVLIVDLDLRIEPGEILTIMGASGSGKSTALLAVIGALPADFTMQGHIWLRGVNICPQPTHKRGIGLLFQDDILFGHLSVGGNLAFALPPHIKGRAARNALIESALESADLAGYAGRDPATLSGGQRARVALLRSLLARPKALLLDEPFSRLDAALRAQMRNFVFSRIRNEALPSILVTHDEQDAQAAGGRVISPLGVPL